MTIDNHTRLCISCRKEYSRENLVRITKLAGEESLVINPDRYQHGRSAYVCRSKDCINGLIKGKKLAKVLKVSLQNAEKIIPELEVKVGKGVLVAS